MGFRSQHENVVLLEEVSGFLGSQTWSTILHEHRTLVDAKCAASVSPSTPRHTRRVKHDKTPKLIGLGGCFVEAAVYFSFKMAPIYGERMLGVVP